MDHAHLTGQKSDGTFRRCVFPCQQRDAQGNRIERECGVSVDPNFGGPTWTASGPPDAPTLTPSINCKGGTCWHGFIINGEVRP